MQKVYRRINGLLHIAEKREKRGGEVDKIVGRQVTRNLKMVKKILHEEIVQCGWCVNYASAEDAAEVGYITDCVADLLIDRFEGYCTYKNRNDVVPINGYCHRGVPCRK